MEKIIKPGDKLEIRIVQQVEMNESNGEPIHVYKSSVEDILEDDTIEIDMPIEAGRVILLPLDVRYEFIFFSKNSLYRARGVIKERYRRDNIYILRIEFKTQLSKYQRREYYRYPCLMDLLYVSLTDDEWEQADTVKVYNDIVENGKNRLKKGRVLDLSGGGMRFTTDISLDGNDYLMIIVRLCNDSMDKQYAIAGRLIASDAVADTTKVYQNRIQFVFRDLKIREEIIRYIFEEERNLRNKNTL